MYRHVFGSDEVADLVMRVIGEIEPVGESHTDNARLVHLQILLNTLDILIDEVTFVLPNERRDEASMEKAGREVRTWLKEKYRQLGYNLGEGEKDEDKRHNL